MAEYRILQGDCLDRLRELDAGTVQTCITSPPFWGLRDYGTATWEGGDPECGHSPARPERSERPRKGLTGGLDYVAAQDGGATAQQTCGCGARRVDSQLGLEPTPDLYVENLVNVFREVRRVLRDDGTVWLNLGDSYASSPPGNKGEGAEKWRSSGLHGAVSEKYADTLNRGTNTKRNTIVGGLKPKDLVGIPWRVAFALQRDGWWLRSDIVWNKPNPMPESVTDRPTRSHEYLFLLAKSARYFYDADAVREEAVVLDRPEGLMKPGGEYETLAGRNDGDWPRSTTRGFGAAEAGRNKRSVWTVATQPYPGAHFATFPPKLIEPCILAGSAPDDLVLDPFCGAGTTGLVALRHDRDFVGIELNPGYVQMARDRIYQDGPLLNVEAA